MDSRYGTAALVRKIDFRLLPLVCLMYTLSFIDRVNIGFAKIYGIEESLRLSPSEYGWCLSAFFIGYAVFQIPSSLVLKWLTPRIWFATILCLWGAVTILMAFSSGFAGLVVLRLFLGILEAGLFPGIVFCTGLWYTRQEQGLRLAIISSSNVLAGGLGGIIAYLVYDLLDGRLDLMAWQWLFIVEGVPTVLLGLIVWVALPRSPKEANFLNTEDRQKLIHRLEASHVELDYQKFDPKQAAALFKDKNIYLQSLVNVGLLTPFSSTSLFLPTLVKSMGFGTLQTALLTIPPNLVGFVVSLFISKISDRQMARGYYLMGGSGLGIVGFVMLSFAQSTIWRYLALILINCGLTTGMSINLSWLNNNFTGATKAAIAPTVMVMAGCVGGIVGGHFYQPSEASTNFFTSNAINIGCLVFSILCAITLRYSLARENRRLDHDDTMLTHELIDTSVTKKPQFRYIL